MVELMCDTEEKRKLLTVGGGYSSIFAPDGAPLAQRQPADWEGLVLAEIDLGKISLAKAAADPAGYYARADVTRLLINRSPNARVHDFRLPLGPESVNDIMVGGKRGSRVEPDTWTSSSS